MGSIPILNSIRCLGGVHLHGTREPKAILQIKGRGDVRIKKRWILCCVESEGQDIDGSPSTGTTGRNALDAIEAGAVASSVCLATASVICRSERTLESIQRKETGPEKRQGVVSTKAVVDHKGGHMPMADQLAIWTIIPLSIAAACRLLIERFQGNKPLVFPKNVGNELLRMEKRTMVGKREVAAVDDKLTRMRLRLKIVHRNLREGVNELSEESSRHQDKLVALAVELDTLQTRLQDYDDVLLKMQDASLRQFTALVQAVERIEAKFTTVEHEGAHAGTSTEE